MKNVLKVLGLSAMMLFLSNCNSEEESTAASVTDYAEIAAYQVAPLMFSGLSEAISTSVDIDSVQINTGTSSANCSVSGTASIPSITYQNGQTEMTTSVLFSACTEAVSVCSSTENLSISGTLNIGVVATYNLLLGTAPSDEDTVITISGTLAVTGLLAGSCVIDLTTTVIADTIDMARTAAEAYEYLISNSTGTICGQDVTTLSLTATEFCSGI